MRVAAWRLPGVGAGLAAFAAAAALLVPAAASAAGIVEPRLGAEGRGGL